MIRITSTALAVLGATAALGLAACGSSDDGSSETAAPAARPVAVTGAWARTTAPNAKTGAAYMTISSTGGDTLTAVSVPSSIAEDAQLHETMSEGAMTSGGMTAMKRVQRIAIPAAGSVQLKPGGYHVMLMGLAGPIAAGDSVPLTLTFAKAGTVTVDAVARES